MPIPQEGVCADCQRLKAESRGSACLKCQALRAAQSHFSGTNQVPAPPPTYVRLTDFLRRVAGYVLISLGFLLISVAIFSVTLSGGYFLLFPCLFLFPLVRFPFYYGKRLVARRATELQSLDARRSVLFLRSFSDDQLPVATVPWLRRFLLARYFPWHYTTFEELIVQIFSQCGPVVAVGRAGQTIPPLGAAREWISHANWQQKVEELARNSSLIIVSVGVLKQEAGLAWEVQRIFQLQLQHKTILVLPPVSEKIAQARWEDLVVLSGGALPNFQGGELAVSFSQDGRPQVFRGSPRRWEREYLSVLLPIAKRHRVKGRNRFAGWMYQALRWILPLGDSGGWSESLSLSWNQFVLFLWYVVLFSLIQRPLLLAALVLASAFGFGWCVTLAEEGRLRSKY